MEFFSNINVQYYLAAYLISGIPFGLLLVYAIAKVDLRKVGSGSIGATNVLRVLKERHDPMLARKAALATLVLDASKGAAVLGFAMMQNVDPATLWAIAVLAVVGHCFSPYLLFEGGKGVATAFGVMLLLLPVEALLGLLAWAVAGKVLKISSLASLVGLGCTLVASFILHPEIPQIQSHAPIVLIGILIFYKHLPNLFRLSQQKEQPIL